MKNIDIRRATKSSSPMITTAIASTPVTRVALRGSLAGPAPRARNRLAPPIGTQRSRAMACSMRGATRQLPMAEDSVAQARPIGMIGPQTAMSAMTSSWPASCSGVAEVDSLRTTAR